MLIILTKVYHVIQSVFEKSQRLQITDFARCKRRLLGLRRLEGGFLFLERNTSERSSLSYIFDITKRVSIYRHRRSHEVIHAIKC